MVLASTCIYQNWISKKIKILFVNFNVVLWNNVFPGEKLNKTERKRSLWQNYEWIGCTNRAGHVFTKCGQYEFFSSSNNRKILHVPSTSIYSSWNEYVRGEKKNRTISKFKFISTREICIFHLVQEVCSKFKINYKKSWLKSTAKCASSIVIWVWTNVIYWSVLLFKPTVNTCFSSILSMNFMNK